jgi:hypothetical protein
MKERLDYLNNTETHLMRYFLNELTDKLGDQILCTRFLAARQGEISMQPQI